MAKKFKGGMHGRDVIYHFKNPAMDFFFQWVLGMSTNGGSTVGECFSAASKIREGDTESWARNWDKLGSDVQKRAENSLKNNHIISARESFLRAYTYYRASVLFLSPFEDSKYKEYLSKARSCFKKALLLFEIPVTSFEIPYNGSLLPGYFFTPDDSAIKRKTLIMIGGGDTFVEDLYFYIVPSGIKRDYNVLIIDLPGQGSLPYEGLPWIPETEIPMAKVVDYLLEQQGVDEDKIAAMGISGGGYLVPRAATKEKRIKAICASAIVLSFEKHWTELTKIPQLAKIEDTLAFSLLKSIKRKSFGVASGLIDTYKWRWGVKSMKELIEVSKPMYYDPSDITCPTLILIGESEFNLDWSRHCAEVSMEKISNKRKKVIITPLAEGAEGHAIGTNISLMSQLVFDWFDETFD